jgi:type I restriction enzyme S subunit
MREGWDIKTLGEIGKVSMCKRILKKQTSPIGDIPFYKIGTFGKIPNAFISKEVYKEYLSKYSFPKKGDILLSASGTIGRRVIYDGKPAYFQDSNIVWIANNEEKVLNEYLYKFYSFCNWNPSRGATISRLYNDDLRRIRVSFPKSLEEQKQIVEILDKAFIAIDQAKANIEKNIANAKELFQSKLNAIFSQKGYGWEEKTLREVCEKTTNIKWQDYPNKEFEYVDLSSVSRESLTITETTLVNKENAPSRARKIINVGDVIFATTRPTLKRATIIDEELSGNLCSTGFVVLRPNDNITTDWIFFYLLTTIFMDRMESLQRGASYPAVSDNDVKGSKLSIPISRLEEKKNIETMNNLQVNINDLVFQFQQKLKDLEELKKSILQKAFSGELTQKEVVV